MMDGDTVTNDTAVGSGLKVVCFETLITQRCLPLPQIRVDCDTSTNDTVLGPGRGAM